MTVYQPHDLIIAKFEVYGLSKSSWNLLLDYLTSRNQRVKIDSSYSLWNRIKRGVPQGSVLGPLLFNTVINDIFMFIEKSEICMLDVKILLAWFSINSLQANPGKRDFVECKFLTLVNYSFNVIKIAAVST